MIPLRTGWLGLAAAGLVALAGNSVAAQTRMFAAENDAMSENAGPPRSSSRIRAPMVAPVSYRGVRYEQVKDSARQGYLMATEEATGKQLWIVQVYAVAIDPNREADVQEVYFRRMEVDRAQARLLIENERGARFAVDLESGAVTPLS